VRRRECVAMKATVLAGDALLHRLLLRVTSMGRWRFLRYGFLSGRQGVRFLLARRVPQGTLLKTTFYPCPCKTMPIGRQAEHPISPRGIDVPPGFAPLARYPCLKSAARGAKNCSFLAAAWKMAASPFQGLEDSPDAAKSEDPGPR
jgi:hypothetical protein